MKKLLIAMLLTTTLLMFTGFTNKNFFDLTYEYHYAIIALPNDEVVEGKVEWWNDYADGDQIQIKIEGVVYLTDTTRAVLICDYSHNKY